MFDLRLKSVIGMGIGAGSYILTRFAVSFPSPSVLIIMRLIILGFALPANVFLLLADFGNIMLLIA